MHNENTFSSKDKLPYIVVNDKTVIEISQSFLDMTEYLIEELQNKSVEELFAILRVGPVVNIDCINDKADCFLLNKSLEVKLVSIQLIQKEHRNIYVFIEKPNSSFDVKFPFIDRMCSDNYYGIGIYSLPELTLLKANEKYISFFDEPNNTKEKCIGKRIDEFITRYKGSTLEEIWKTILATGNAYNIEEYKHEGFERGVTYWRSTITPIYENGTVKYCVEMTMEITEQVLYRKKIEEQAKVIEKQKEQLEVIVDNMSDQLMMFDKDGNFIFKNKAALKDAFINNCTKFSDLYRPEMNFDMEGNEISYTGLPVVRILNGEKVIDQIIFSRNPESEKYLGISGTPLYDDDGNFLMGIICVRDITENMMKDKEIKRHQETALKAEREKNESLEKAIEMKDEFLSLISHEFRTPLNVINTAIQTLNFVYANEMTDKVKEYMGTIKQNIYRQLRLVNNLLDITRANAGRIKINKKNIDIVLLTKAITESVYEYASRKGVRITFVSTISKRIIGVDDEKYERIILNLLSNAIKFTPEGKSVVVNLRTVKGSICVEVKDTGIGVPPNKIDLIFEKFGQVDSSLSRQAEGSGIGLSLVKKFVEALGGSISVKSKVGKGSCFTILLPNEKAVEEHDEKPMVDLMNNRFVQTTNVEFSDVYL